MIKIEIEGQAELMKDFEQYEKEAQKALVQATLIIANKVRNDSITRLKGGLGSAKHWITGRLQSSIHIQKKGDESYSYKDDNNQSFEGGIKTEIAVGEVIVGTNVEYAANIEFNKDSFLNYAAVRNAPKFKTELIRLLNKIKK